MKNNINKLMDEGNLQNKESWVTLFLNDGEKITGQVIDYNNNRVIMPINQEFEEDEDVLIIPTELIKYFSCGVNNFSIN